MQYIKPKTVDEYIALYPKEAQQKLEQMRATVKKVAPKAEESINYGIPTFKLNGNLVHFAAYKHHIGFYPAPSGIITFKKELATYKNSKGAVQFPIDQPLPVALIKKIVKFRIKENLKKEKNTHE